jgi:hypothetical protein
MRARALEIHAQTVELEQAELADTVRTWYNSGNRFSHTHPTVLRVDSATQYVVGTCNQLRQATAKSFLYEGFPLLPLPGLECPRT